jgi:hypothetical protein
MITTKMAAAYHDELAQQIFRRDQECSALVEALVQGRVTATV